MNILLLYISSLLIIISFLGYLLVVIFGTEKVTDSNGFDIIKDIISEYDNINVIESKSYFTVYNIKRRVIKLSTKCYYGKNVNDVSLALIEAGISSIDNNNKYIDFFRKIFSNLKLLYFFSVLSLLINHFTYNVSDARISLVFLIVFSIISYVLVDIKNEAFLWIKDNINKIKNINNVDIVVCFINKFLFFDKIIFFGQLVMIIRFISIILDI